MILVSNYEPSSALNEQDLALTLQITKLPPLQLHLTDKLIDFYEGPTILSWRQVRLER